MRTLWLPNFPPVHVHSRWDPEGYAGHVLPEHPSYWPAKTRRDTKAAAKLCDDIVREAVLETLFDICHAGDGRPPVRSGLLGP